MGRRAVVVGAIVGVVLGSGVGVALSDGGFWNDAGAPEAGAPPTTAVGRNSEARTGPLRSPTLEEIDEAKALAARDPDVADLLASGARWEFPGSWFTDAGSGSEFRGVILDLVLSEPRAGAYDYRLITYEAEQAAAMRSTDAASTPGPGYVSHLLRRDLPVLTGVRVTVDLTAESVPGLSPLVGSTPIDVPEVPSDSD